MVLNVFEKGKGLFGEIRLTDLMQRTPGRRTDGVKP